MHPKITPKRVVLASAASIFWVLLGLGNMSAGHWSQQTAILFVILAPVITFIVAVTVEANPQGLLGAPDEKREAFRQIRTQSLIWVAAVLIFLVVFKLLDWYQVPWRHYFK